MKITDLTEQVEKLPKRFKTPILALIEMKTECDMEKMLQKFDNIEKRLENKIKAQESKINILLWAIGALGVLITIYKFIG